MDSGEPEPPHDCNRIPDAADHSPCASNRATTQIYLVLYRNKNAGQCMCRRLLWLAVIPADRDIMDRRAAAQPQHCPSDACSHKAVREMEEMVTKHVACGPASPFRHPPKISVASSCDAQGLWSVAG